MCRLSWNLGASTSWNPQGLSRPVMGLLYLYLYLYRVILTIKNVLFYAVALIFVMKTGVFSMRWKVKFYVQLSWVSLFSCLRPTFTSRTNVHSLGVLGAVNFLFAHDKCTVSLQFLIFIIFFFYSSSPSPPPSLSPPV